MAAGMRAENAACDVSRSLSIARRDGAAQTAL
jgi:hypothetical protein